MPWAGRSCSVCRCRLSDKRLHERQGNWFQGAFIVLQAGVVLCTIASSAKRKELWATAIALGVVGLALVACGFFIGLQPPV